MPAPPICPLISGWDAKSPMVTLFDQLDQDTANTYSLVLDAVGIGHRISVSGGRCRIEVPEPAIDAAELAIDRYLAENPVSATVATVPTPHRLPLSAPAVALGLLAVHLAVITSSAPEDYFSVFGADARRILSGELYRCATALLLHADAAHLVGNMVGMILFGSAVCAFTGSGVGWLMMLACGIAGNLVNAVAYSHGHLSVGASTSVFGAVGTLCAIRSIQAIRTGRGWKAVLVLAGAGVALLAFLGTGARSDLGAHLFGCLAGIVAGVFYGSSVLRPPGRGVQLTAATAAGAILLASWVRGVLG